ncbi:MAG: 16S rRNA (guanine(527)-N(7))-methyltransferase RsmG [Pelagibacteraceae bacterium]|jgi:16S rRNA (guanine527-N7)-methyltransferase|nr:16S rRNA (guanine(527)-N(7))-methyltransferase RsmG [Pelagibacteraceae bacterium]MDP6783838.1 16S rRNA (guanine(527)-N(7))-methyltransferase RsmG [Alphaproteobacteria bacterium]MBO6466430.1 16S rRNA (guanine(527)-N(7))-methyltransferase RsmG [Pelagibacteraceae bacterium]MBO6468390.1 16S rRNA (guanine(527)-N(7))-methyltransferase RsmG [Pelagibacteraceae bacterium]MBO6468591.1 16S rRNA (guanine(527)-N(7))-methyltransferase RsmG [Pelagibacteraceae bacterium]|tara:strand:- start:1583 stop:2230 length:648 start_codon:yes stop_codon:yes gene_type:complete
MSEDKRITKKPDLTTLSKTINAFSINSSQESMLIKFLKELVIHNKLTNLVGKSTLENPWRSHILDCIQISSFIKNRNSTILDMGTGPGLPGLVLAIIGYKNVNLVDSNRKKINFVKHIATKLNIGVKIYLSRIEKLNDSKFDFLISRALANLNKLFIYSHKLIDKDTVLIFLKGKKVKNEIHEAKKIWSFNSEIYPSQSDERGSVLIVKNLKLKI